MVAGEFVRVSARAGEVALRIGLERARGRVRGGGEEGMDVDGESESGGGGLDEETRKMGKEVALECRGMGGTLEAIGQVIEACLSDEIIKSKYVLFHKVKQPTLTLIPPTRRHHLKEALTQTSLSQDNHLRALILALISSHYFHTASDQAQGMLGTCEQFAAGLGAGSVKREGGKGKEGAGDAVGNAPLRLWVGERFLGMLSFFFSFSLFPGPLSFLPLLLSFRIKNVWMDADRFVFF